MLRVKDVDYQGDYRLALTFSDGVHKVVDLEPHLTGEVFELCTTKSSLYNMLSRRLLSNGQTEQTSLLNTCTKLELRHKQTRFRAGQASLSA